MNISLYEYLRDIAARRGSTTYALAGAVVNLDMTNQAHRNEISRLLDEISEFEHHENRPLLSACVIRNDLGRPGNGFFEMAQRIGLFLIHGGDRDQFWINELRRVHDYWANI